MKAIFTEIHSQLGMTVVVGELEIHEKDMEKVHSIAKTSVSMLEQVRGTTISYMLTVNSDTLVTQPEAVENKINDKSSIMSGDNVSEYKLSPEESSTVVEIVEDAIEGGMIASHFELDTLKK